MPRVCTACGLKLDRVITREEAPVTGGLCPMCLARAVGQRGALMRDELDRFPGPVLLVDAEARILGANRQGSAALQWPEGEMDRLLVGDALICRQSDEAGGCGHAPDCETCAILRTIADTAASGRSHSRVAAGADIQRVGGLARVNCVISTEKAGDAVLLRLDELATVA